MTDNEILKMERFTAASPYCTTASLSVYVVAKCNFNDEMLVDSKTLTFSELLEKPLEWFDPYMGRSKVSNIRIALAYVDKDRMYFIEDDGKGNRKVLRKDKLMTHYYVEDLDKATLLSTHIR